MKCIKGETRQNVIVLIHYSLTDRQVRSITRAYYMATIVCTLWSAAEQARFPCNDWALLAGCSRHIQSRVRKYAKFGVFYAKIFQITPQRLRRESLQLQKFSVTNSEPLRLQKFSVTVLPLPFSQQIEFMLIVNVVNLN